MALGIQSGQAALRLGHGVATHGLLCKRAPSSSALIPASRDHGFLSRFPPAHKQEQGSQPLQQLGWWPPMTTRAPWVSLSVTAFAEVPSTLWTAAPTTPVPSRSTRALIGHLLFQEVHTPIHGHSVEVLSPPASSGMVTCDLAWKTMRKQQPGGQPNKTNTRPPSRVATASHWASFQGSRH